MKVWNDCCMKHRGLLLALAATGVLTAAGDPLEQKATQVLELALGSKNPETRKMAAVALSLAGTGEALVARLENLADDKDVEVRLATIASLADLHTPRARAVLQRAMNDATPEVSFSAARALWGLKDTSGRGLLLSVLAGESKASSGILSREKRDAIRMLHTPRTAFLTVLREGGGFVPMPGLGEGIASMQALLGDANISGRATAALLLGGDPNPETLAALKDALGDKTWSVRAAAIHSLALRNDPAMKNEIAPLMDDSNEAVRLRAAAGYLRLRTVELQAKPGPGRGAQKTNPGRGRE